ncbi:MAG: ABC transporter substrate-binding protein [Kangiellaceae bacterium]|nr:ABC transporter substrate-binding protein [Kangiellaceae bacterium]MCW9000663.1 ABC transporter substrate-binding protein [Kangiellaceae bacterium]MCW9017472.1 ABC transporter substrate-binding protein [Kangiellaceae bacterium]
MTNKSYLITRRPLSSLAGNIVTLSIILFFSFISLSTYSKDGGKAETLRVVYFSKDVPAIAPLFPAFDPDSYAVISQIFDSLVHFDLDGNITPALAVSWRQESDLVWVFKLRKGVSFHNGEKFDGHAVKFTYEAALNPETKAGNAWILSSIKSIEVNPEDPHEVTITTHFPDGMFLNRLNLFGSVCPPKYIKKVGLKQFFQRPVGTGPYKFKAWSRGQSIELEKNENYWNRPLPYIPRLVFNIIPEDKWIEQFVAGNIDFLPNLAGNQTTIIKKKAHGKVKILKRKVLSGYWVLLNNRGPLADKRVRLAMNYAINKKHLVTYADFSNAVPLASLGKTGEFGANPELKPYEYNPVQAKGILKSTEVKLPIKLKVIVADIAAPIGKIIRSNLAAVGIETDMSIVPRSEWAEKVVNFKIQTGQPSDYDLAINLVDNPIYNLAFHAGLFLHSESPWSLLQDSQFDQKFIHALQSADRETHRKRLEALDAYIHEEALMLFTTQRIITAAVRKGVDIPKYGLNGHLGYFVLTTATFSEEANP